MGVCFNELALIFYLLLSLGRGDGKECQGSEGIVREQGREKKKNTGKSVDREHLEVFSGEHSSVRVRLFIC